MKRFFNVNVVATILGAATPGLVAVGCGGVPSHTDDVGSVSLAITLSNNVVVDEVLYQIFRRPDVIFVDGRIPVSDPGATISSLINGMTEGAYYFRVTAVSTDGQMTCTTPGLPGFKGKYPADVIAGQTTFLTFVLSCRPTTPTTGSISINGTIDVCPMSIVHVSPLSINVGGVIDVAATASDPDPGDTLTYAWSELNDPNPPFGNTTASETTYTCSTAGPHTLTLNVSDGSCGTGSMVTVTCTPEAPAPSP